MAVSSPGSGGAGRRAAIKGDLDGAVRNFSEAIRIDPKYPDSYSERGQALFKLGETERAIADYSAAIQRDPQFGAALRARGMAYLYRGSADLALADLSRARERLFVPPGSANRPPSRPEDIHRGDCAPSTPPPKEWVSGLSRPATH